MAAPQPVTDFEVNRVRAWFAGLHENDWFFFDRDGMQGRLMAVLDHLIAENHNLKQSIVRQEAALSRLAQQLPEDPDEHF